MIVLDAAAHMECDEEDCKARLGVKLALTLAGTFAACPEKGHGWQVLKHQNGVFIAHCPAHHEQTQRIGPPDAPVIQLVRH